VVNVLEKLKVLFKYLINKIENRLPPKIRDFIYRSVKVFEKLRFSIILSGSFDIKDESSLGS
jgi:hypothetical protein